MATTNLPAWAPRYTYSDHLVEDLCATAAARAVVELLPLPPDENLRLRHGAYQRSTRSSTRIEGNPLDDHAVRLAVASSDRTGGKAEQEVRNYWRALEMVEDWAQGKQPLSEAWIQQLTRCGDRTGAGPSPAAHPLPQCGSAGVDIHLAVTDVDSLSSGGT